MEIKQLYQTFFTSQPRSFIDILLYCQDKQVLYKKLVSTVNELRKQCSKDISCDKVIAQLGNNAQSDIMGLTPVNRNHEIEYHSLEQLKEISQMVKLL